MINKLLEKLNIKSVLDLNDEEKRTFEQWQKVLDKDEVSVKEIKEFIDFQVALTTEQLLSYKNTKDKDIYLKAQLRNYRNLKSFIESPTKNKEVINQYINNLK
mgnify:CR=1 FL=1